MRREQGGTKAMTSVRLSPEAKRLLALLAQKRGVSQTALVEDLIHDKARHEKVMIAEDTPGTEAARQRFISLLEQAQRNDPGDLTPEELEREVTLAHEAAREILHARRR